MNLTSLRKCAEGVGVGVVKVTADEVKGCVTAALDQPGSNHPHLQPVQRKQQGFLCALRGRV